MSRTPLGKFLFCDAKPPRAVMVGEYYSTEQKEYTAIYLSHEAAVALIPILQQFMDTVPTEPLASDEAFESCSIELGEPLVNTGTIEEKEEK